MAALLPPVDKRTDGPLLVNTLHSQYNTPRRLAYTNTATIKKFKFTRSLALMNNGFRKSMKMILGKAENDFVISNIR